MKQIVRRTLLGWSAAAAALPSTLVAPGNALSAPASDGVLTQPWFHNSFLDLKDDLAEASEAGKRLMVLWEQRGCPYCHELHNVNFADAETVAYLKKHFVVLQLDLYGAREVTDFDGKTFEERKLAPRWRISFTPTVNFYPDTVEPAAGKYGREAEAWRLQGYWKPFHFLANLVYVVEKGYESEPNFQKWLVAYADRRRAEGKSVKMW